MGTVNLKPAAKSDKDESYFINENDELEAQKGTNGAAHVTDVGMRGNSYPRIGTIQASTNILALSGLPFSPTTANMIIWNGFPAEMRYFEMVMKSSDNLPWAHMAFVVVNAANDAAAIADLSLSAVPLGSTGAADNGALWVTKDAPLQINTISQAVDITSLHIMPVLLEEGSAAADDVIFLGRGVVLS